MQPYILSICRKPSVCANITANSMKLYAECTKVLAASDRVASRTVQRIKLTQ